MVALGKRDWDALRFLWINDIKKEHSETYFQVYPHRLLLLSPSLFLLNEMIRTHIERYRDDDPLLDTNF